MPERNSTRITTWVFLAVLLFALPRVSNVATASQSGSPPEMAGEPHHQLIFQNELVRVFAITIPSGEESVVRHDRNFLTVTLQDSDLVLWRDGESPIIHYTFPTGEARFWLAEPYRGMRNETHSTYRNITVEFFDPQVTSYGYIYGSGGWDYGPTILGTAAVDPNSSYVNSLFLQTAMVNYVQLLPGDNMPAADEGSSELVIAVAPIDLAVGDAKIRLHPGQVTWIDRRPREFVNAGKSAARFVLVRFP